MPIYSITSARKRLSELIRRAERGEEIVIARRGKPIARLIPQPAEVLPAGSNQAALDRLQRTREMLRASGVTFTLDEIRRYRDEGRAG